jgi:hypothetical protein
MVFKFLKQFTNPPVKEETKIDQTSLNGEVHNLQEIYVQLNARYFQNDLELPIQWFGYRHVHPRTQLTFGTYTEGSGLIRIHRLLDQSHVPEYFVAFIIYHEMLHHILPPIKLRHRRVVHHEKFRAKEREFHAYDEAKEFREVLKDHYFKGRGRFKTTR